MTQILAPIDGPSPNVGSGLTPPYGKATDTVDGVATEGTGLGLGATGIAGGTMTDGTAPGPVPSTRAVSAVDSSSSGINSGLAATKAAVTNPTTVSLPSDMST
jgi:hypothetical protein